MAITNGGLLTDPDSLSYEITSTGTTELFIDNTTLKIRLVRTGNLTADGVTLKCLYSKLKEVWKANSTLIKYPFPMTPITDEQFEFVNGWDLDKDYVASTAITVASCSGSNATKIITTSGNFNTSNIIPGMYVSGTNVGTAAKVVSVDSDTQITVTVDNAGAVSGSLVFWTDNDYTYNLIRTGGWALKDTSGVTQEEWIGIISLGNLGSEQTNKTLTLTAGTTTSTTIQVASTTGLVVGSYITGPSIPSGTTIASVTDSTHFVISKSVTITNGALVTIRPKDQIYYQIGTSSASAINLGLTGPVNQAIKTYGDASHGNFDYRDTGSILKLYVREQGWTYGSSKKEDIGVNAQMTYQVYRFPLTNASDSVKITHTDVQIDANGDNTADVSPYSNMGITWYGSPQTRSIGGVNRSFNIIIDADTTNGTPAASGPATAEQIYEFVQWSLRRNTDIDAGAGSAVGNITRDLVKFVGDTLYTLYDATDTDGVYIDNFNSADTNRIVFADNTGTNRTFPYTAAGTLQFNTYLVTDGAGSNAIYRLFFKQLNDAAFGTATATIVKKADNTTDISGIISGSAISFDFDYDGNTQAEWQPTTVYIQNDEYRNGTTWYRVTTGYTSGGTFGATDTTNNTVISGPSVILVAVGLTNAQYVQSDGVIARSISNSLSAVSALERNYSNPA
ncbi:MAG: hypothetical protein ACXW2E_00115 [Nitrososphaeraceae archaeon]